MEKRAQFVVAGAFAAMLAVTLLIAAMLFLGARHVASLSQWVVHSEEVRAVLNRVAASATSVESSMRGYLVSQHPEFLAANTEAVERSRTTVAELAALTSDNVDQHRRVRELEDLLAQKIAFSQRVIETTRSDGRNAGAALFDTLEGARLSRQIESVVAATDDEETRLVISRTHALEGAEAGAVRFGIALTLVACALIAFVYYISGRERTHRLRAEAASAEVGRQSAVLRGMLASMSDAVVVADAQGRFLHTNPAAEELLGVRLVDNDPGEWSHDYNLYLGDGVTPFPADSLPLARAMRGESCNDIQMIVRRPDQSEPRWIEVSGRPLLLESGQMIGGVVVFRDVTDRKQGQAEIVRYASEVHDLYNGAPCGYHALDENGVIVKINDTELEWLGYLRSELVGRMPLQDLMVPESRDRFHENFPLFKQRGWAKDLEFTLRRRDGSTFDVLVNAIAVQDASGKYVSSRSTLFDITERKRAESEASRLHADLELRQGELEAAYAELEGFSYSVSHDLRAPLRHMAGFLQLLATREESRLEEASSRYLRLAREAATRMGGLIDDLLAFSRTTRAEMKVQRVPLDDLVHSIRRDLERDEHRDVEWSIGPLPPVQGDPVLLRQVWTNLLSNALKYTRPRERAEIEVADVSLDSDEEVVLVVRDNGVGFDPEYGHKLFGVFQRLHGDEFEGTGIGLAIVQRVVHRHGGRVWAESTPGQGAAFYVALPRAQEKEAGQASRSGEIEARNAI